jgi:hypothetical protein
VIDDDIADFEKEDPFDKRRKHAWIYIDKGPREMADSFFVEPTTGRRYEIKGDPNLPYYSIEAIFNNINYWINMDPTRGLDDDFNYEFEDDGTGDWEYIMLKQNERKAEGDYNDEDEDFDEENEEELQDEVLDMPPSWSPKLFISKDKYGDICAKGEKCVFYEKCKVEFFSDCKQVDGLVQRITIYEDYKKLIKKEVRSFYKYRRDKLVLRRRFPYSFKTVEHYEQSDKTHNWKKMV